MSGYPGRGNDRIIGPSPGAEGGLVPVPTYPFFKRQRTQESAAGVY
jgi:hypothetical protein